ncbi:MAG: GTP-binding protein, partial [Planctomycetota bacterium]|nr:GTP-binding protein [Planctomycetota bacterium]
GTGLYDEEAASRMAGWFKELNGEHTPETEEYGISSFVYRRRKPFHPERLMNTLNGALGGVVRSKGYLWVATRPRYCGVWSQAGSSLQLDRGGLWFAAVQRENWPTDPATLDYLETIWTEEVGDCRQELVFIGVRLDQGAIEAVLDEALITDDEMSAGPEHWLTFQDPLPSWDHSQPA